MPIPGAIPSKSQHLHPCDTKRPAREGFASHPGLEFAPKHRRDLLQNLTLFLPVKQKRPHINPEGILCIHEKAQELIVLARVRDRHSFILLREPLRLPKKLEEASRGSFRG
jgi:hypothetical protein